MMKLTQKHFLSALNNSCRNFCLLDSRIKHFDRLVCIDKIFADKFRFDSHTTTKQTDDKYSCTQHGATVTAA